MVYMRYNCWRHDTPITLAQKGFWILVALLIPMNPEEPDFLKAELRDAFKKSSVILQVLMGCK